MRHPAAIVLTWFTALTVSAEEVAPGARFRGLESVKAFDEVLAELGRMREMILADSIDQREASEGMRFLLRTLAMAQDVSGDAYPSAPHFARMDTPRRKIGGDNPNAEYDSTAWDGRQGYRIHGNAGTLDHLSFTVLVREPNGRSRSIGYVNERSLEPDEEGNFALWLTNEKPSAPGVWIRTQRDQRGSVLIRQYLGDPRWNHSRVTRSRSWGASRSIRSRPRRTPRSQREFAQCSARWADSASCTTTSRRRSSSTSTSTASTCRSR